MGRVKEIVLLAIILICFACEPESKKNNESLAGSNNPCELYKKYLKGEFSTPRLEGKAIFTGDGISGEVEFVGSGYNDIVCQYRIIDCKSGNATVTCETNPFEQKFELLDKDRFKLDYDVYTRIK